jgi:hypothetical protein
VVGIHRHSPAMAGNDPSIAGRSRQWPGVAGDTNHQLYPMPAPRLRSKPDTSPCTDNDT